MGPWTVLVSVIEPHSPRTKTGRPPFAIETMLRIHCLQPVDATLIAAPSSTKNASASATPRRARPRRQNNWYIGMKAHIGVDADSGLVHTVAGTAAHMSHLDRAGSLLHGQEKHAFADAGYQGVHKRDEATGPSWHVAMRRGKRKKLTAKSARDSASDTLGRDAGD